MVVDQWTDRDAGKRTLPFLGKDDKGAWIDRSNNGDAFSIIELE
ncbi:BPSL0067 family protein [Nitrosospira briensis]